MQQPSILKYPAESRQYYVDFSSQLATGETLSSATVSGVYKFIGQQQGQPISLSFDGSLTIGSPSISSDGFGVVTRFSDGTAGSAYDVQVIASGSSGNIYTNDITIGVEQASWMVEWVATLRVLIGDLTVPPTYSDSRLLQVLLVGAQYVQQEIALNSNYNISVNDYLLNPDPTSSAAFDQVFSNFSVLKAACFIDQSALRTKATLGGIKAVLGPASLDTAGYLQGFIKVLENGPCASYQTLKLQYGFGNLNIMSAVLSPFINNKFDPRMLYPYICQDASAYGLRSFR